MKVTVEKRLYETVNIDDKFAPVLEKSKLQNMGYTPIWTEEDEELLDELIRLAIKNTWDAGYTGDEYKDIYWEI